MVHRPSEEKEKITEGSNKGKSKKKNATRSEYGESKAKNKTRKQVISKFQRLLDKWYRDYEEM